MIEEGIDSQSQGIKGEKEKGIMIIGKIKFVKINGKDIVDSSHQEMIEKINLLIEQNNEQEKRRKR